MNWFIILFHLISFSSALEIHAIYLSVSEVEIADHQIDLEIKVFADDLLDVLRNSNDQLRSKVDVLDTSEVIDYFNSKISLVHNMTELTLEDVDIELNGDSYFLNFTVYENISSTLSFKFGHFFELFPEQQNIVKVNNNNQKQYYIFKSKEQEESIILSQ